MLDATAIRERFNELAAVKGGGKPGNRAYRTISSPGEVDVVVDVHGPAAEHRVFIPASGADEMVATFPEWRVVGLRAGPSPSGQASLVIALQGQDAEYLGVFCRLIEDLGDALATVRDEDRRRAILMQRLAQWHEFLQEKRFLGLTEEQQRGLYGELYFLREHMLGSLPPAACVRMWLGPDRSRHDFVGDRRAVEVKTLQARHGPIAKISSEFQLDDTDLDRLWLWVISVTAGMTGESLPQIIADLNRVVKEPAVLQEFHRKLFAIGYLDEHVSRYADRFYEVQGEQAYLVGEGFPRLIGTRPQIQNVRYELDTSHCGDFRVEDTRTVLQEFLQ